MSSFDTYMYRCEQEHNHRLLDDRNQRLAAILASPGPLGPNHPAHRSPHPAECPSNPTSTPLLRLPTELHLEIFSHIRAKEDVCEAPNPVCRKFYGVYYDEDYEEYDEYEDEDEDEDENEDGDGDGDEVEDRAEDEAEDIDHVGDEDGDGMNHHVHGDDEAHGSSSDHDRDLVQPQIDEKQQTHVGVDEEPQVWLWTVLALRGTSRFFRHVLPALTHMELLQLEVTLRAASRTLLACRYCLRLRPARHFSRTQNKQYRVPLDALLNDSHMGFKSFEKRGKRMCLDCGFAQVMNPSIEIEKSRYPRGADVIVDGVDGHGERWVWCWWCGILKKGDDAGTLATSGIACKVSEVKAACEGSCLQCCIDHGCTGSCVVAERRRRRAAAAAEEEEEPSHVAVQDKQIEVQ